MRFGDGRSRDALEPKDDFETAVAEPEMLPTPLDLVGGADCPKRAYLMGSRYCPGTPAESVGSVVAHRTRGRCRTSHTSEGANLMAERPGCPVPFWLPIGRRGCATGKGHLRQVALAEGFRPSTRRVVGGLGWSWAEGCVKEAAVDDRGGDCDEPAVVVAGVRTE